MTHELSRDWTPIACRDHEQVPTVEYRGNRRVVTSGLHMPEKPAVATTVHDSTTKAAIWAATVERSRRGHAPDRDIVRQVDGEYRAEKPEKNWSTIFRWYEQFQGTIMSPRVTWQPGERELARCGLKPEEREQLHVALEGSPYVVKVGERVCGIFAKREQAANVVTRMGTRAQLYHVGARYAWVEGATMVLPRSDRARGPSSVLAGQGTKTVRHRVIVGYDEQRIDATAAHRLDNAMNGAEKRRDKFVTEEQWTPDAPARSGYYDRVSCRWVSTAA